jgi:transcriptional regulator with XRE-family HTH domain
MSELPTLITTLKRLLKAHGLTYRDVAVGLDLSETSVKRLFSNERFTVARLERLAGLFGYTLSELMAEVGNQMDRLHALTPEQEAQLVRNDKLMLIAVCAFNHWNVDDIVATYRLSRAECLKLLLILDRMGLIALLPGDRIRLKVARDFDWLADGPIRRHFIVRNLVDFVDSRFDANGEQLAFAFAMLGAAARSVLHGELRRLAKQMNDLHQGCAVLPRTEKQGVAMLLSIRNWEPRAFAALRRQ